MATCLISGKIVDPSGTSVSGAPVSFNIQTPILTSDPVSGSTTSASDGTWSMSLLRGLSGIFTIGINPTGISRRINYTFNVNIPNVSTASFSSIIVDN